MRPRIVAMSFGVWIALSAACGSDAPEHAVNGMNARDASSADAARERSDAPAADAGAPAASGGELDLHSLVVAALIETESSLVARCPCLTASGVYASMRACTDAVTLGRNWIDCVNGLDLTTQDDPQVRESLHCSIRELKQRSECLRGSSCSDDDIVMCMTEMLSCPKLPLELLSRVAVDCQIALSR